MSVEPNSAEGTSNASGEAGKPNQADSQQKGNLSGNADFEKRFNELEKQLRGLQSVTDKRTAEFDGYKGVLSQVKSLQERGLSFEQIEEKLELEELKRAVFGVPKIGNEPNILQGKQDQKPQSDAIAKVLEQLGIQQNDPEVLALRAESDDVQLLTGITKLAVKRAQAPQPTLASIASPAGGGTSAPNEDELVSKLQRLYLAPSQNAAEIKSIEKQLGW